MRRDNAIGVECKVLVNVDINQKAKISRSAFLEKVRYVEQIRTRLNHRYISFYITSLEEYQNLKRFHELVNEGKFDFSGRNTFQQQAAISYDTGQKFALKKQLEEIDEELTDVREKIKEIASE